MRAPSPMLTLLRYPSACNEAFPGILKYVNNYLHILVLQKLYLILLQTIKCIYETNSNSFFVPESVGFTDKWSGTHQPC